MIDDRLLPLWQAVHHRLSSGNSVSSIRVGDWTTDQREALADLLGLDRVPAVGAKLPMVRLESAVAALSDGRDLRAVVEELVGPLDDRKTRHAQAAAEREALWSWLLGHPAVEAEPVLRDWADQLRRAGLVNRSVDGTRDLLRQALNVLQALPADGTPIPIFADQVLGDPHALDDGERLTGIVLRALSCLLGDVPLDHADARRATWQQMGLEGDALSSTVLVAGCRPATPGPAGALLTACADSAQAAVLTLEHVRAATYWRWPPPIVNPLVARQAPVAGPVVQPVQLVQVVEVVHVVENPSVMAAALARFGSHCPPLVCISGWPSAAGILLLRTMAAAGSQLRYHGDLDGDGLRIAAHLVAKVGAQPWRLTTHDYQTALARRPLGPAVGRTVPDVPWDPSLAPAMRAAAIAVTEESVIADLLTDLAAQDSRPPGPQ